MLLEKAIQPDIISHVEGRVFEALLDNGELGAFKTKNLVINTSRQKEKVRVRYIAKTNELVAGSSPVTATLEDAYLFLTQNNN